jgi:hypothetical protein
MLTQYSEGKQLNVDQTDLWMTMLELTLCNAGQGNKPKTHCDISSLLSIQVLSVESIRMDREEKE